MNRHELKELFDAHALEVAPHLLGCELTVTTARGSVTVRLTEVEAYGDQGEDPGAHSYKGRTARNASLFGPPRHAYIYQSYGIHYCLNLTAHAAGAGECCCVPPTFCAAVTLPWSAAAAKTPVSSCSRAPDGWVKDSESCCRWTAARCRSQSMQLTTTPTKRSASCSARRWRRRQPCVPARG